MDRMDYVSLLSTEGAYSTEVWAYLVTLRDLVFAMVRRIDTLAGYYTTTVGSWLVTLRDLVFAWVPRIDVLEVFL